jgi:hypothetical protein
MNKFAMDYTSLQNNLEKKKAYKLEEVKDKIKKVAFDVVRFIDSDNIDGLWQIQHTNEGDYIVAMYGQDGDVPVVKSSSSVVKSSSVIEWNVIADRSGENLNFFYKGTPITRLATASLGVSPSEASFVTSYLPTKLANNPKLVMGLLQEVPSKERQELLTKHPELNK